MALIQENNDCNFCDKVFKVKEKLNETLNTDGMNTSKVDHIDNKLEFKDKGRILRQYLTTAPELRCCPVWYDIANTLAFPATCEAVFSAPLLE